MAPEAFDQCVANKGKMVTKSLPEGQFVYGCSPDGGKTWIWGEVKKKVTLKEAHKKNAKS